MTRLPLLLLALLSAACASAPNPHRLCVAADVAGRTLTASGQALRAVHDADVETQWAAKCGESLGSASVRIACRHEVVDDTAERYRARYATAAQAVEAQHELAEALEASGLCKAGAP